MCFLQGLDSFSSIGYSLLLSISSVAVGSEAFHFLLEAVETADDSLSEEEVGTSDPLLEEAVGTDDPLSEEAVGTVPINLGLHQHQTLKLKHLFVERTPLGRGFVALGWSTTESSTL